MTAEPAPPAYPEYAILLGRRLAEARAATGQSQHQVALSAGIATYTYLKLEAGFGQPNTPANPRLKTLLALSQVLNVSVLQLLPTTAPIMNTFTGPDRRSDLPPLTIEPPELERAVPDKWHDRGVPAATQPPEPEGWISARDAADLLGVRIQAIGWRVEHGHLEGRKHQGMWWVTQASLDAEAADRSEWVSWAEAAELTGVPSSTVGAAVTRGLIRNRPGPNTLRSLHRESVLAWAAQREADLQEKADIRAARDARGKPPDDAHIWLSTVDAALVIGVATTRVNQLVHAGRIPATRVGGRWWFRRDHVEQAAAARTFRARRASQPSPQNGGNARLT